MRISWISSIAFVCVTVFTGISETRASYVQDTVPSSDKSMQSLIAPEDYTSLLSKGYLLINSGNFEDGVKYLCQGFKLKSEQEKSDRVEDFQTTEFIALLNIMNSHLLKAQELQLGYEFVKEATTNKYSTGETNLNKYLAKNKKSVFTRRLKFIYMVTRPSSGDAESYVDKLLELDSTIVSANIFKAKMLVYGGKLSESLSYFSRAIRYMPTYALAYYLRGLVYDDLQQEHSALADYSKAIELYPPFFDAYNNRGNVKLKLNLNREALSDYRKASEIKPDTDWPYLNMALVYRKLNMSDSALVYIQDALDINPRSVLAYNNKADIYLRQKDYGSAVAAFTKSINLEPTNKFAYIGRGDAYFFDHMDAQALQDFEKVIQLDKKNAYALMRIGDCYYQQKEYTKAIGYYEESQKAYPDNIYLLVTKGLCYNQVGKNENAREDLLKAVALDSTNSPALGNLGWVYYCLGDFQKCILFSQKAIRHQDDAFYAMFNIALSTLRLGKYDESIALYKKYIDLSKSQNKENLDGAMTDLRDLIKQNILVKESKYILENLFQQKE